VVCAHRHLPLVLAQRLPDGATCRLRVCCIHRHTHEGAPFGQARLHTVAPRDPLIDAPSVPQAQHLARPPRELGGQVLPRVERLDAHEQPCARRVGMLSPEPHHDHRDGCLPQALQGGGDALVPPRRDGQHDPASILAGCLDQLRISVKGAAGRYLVHQRHLQVFPGLQGSRRKHAPVLVVGIHAVPRMLQHMQG